MKKIPYGKHDITQEDIDAVVNVLKSESLTQGPSILKFEKKFSKYIGSSYAVAVSNGTAALHLCALSLKVQPGDKVITSPITFAATANCIKYCGGEIIFSDIERDTYLLDINEVRKLLIADIKKEIKGIIPVNFAGRVIDMEAFRNLADEFGCWLIEDACHSPGGSFINSLGEKVQAGSGKYADLAIFSFHPVKHIAAGEGGMITTNKKELYDKLLTLRTHGIQQNADKRIFDDSLWYYEMQELGYNYRLTDIQAALGNSQLKRANEGIVRRRQIADLYKKSFIDCPNIVDRNEMTSNNHAYHLYVIEVDKRKELYHYLRENNIFTQVHYVPLHLMPFYRQFGWKEGDFPNSEDYYKKCISLPMYPTLKFLEQEQIINLINEYFG
jgi:hypothetical protein